ncbi:hypothetical protein VTK26DRAFT_498 [Humicola hyalothermophila]
MLHDRGEAKGISSLSCNKTKIKLISVRSGHNPTLQGSQLSVIRTVLGALPSWLCQGPVELPSHLGAPRARRLSGALDPGSSSGKQACGCGYLAIKLRTATNPKFPSRASSSTFLPKPQSFATFSLSFLLFIPAQFSLASRPVHRRRLSPPIARTTSR